MGQPLNNEALHRVAREIRDKGLIDYFRTVQSLFLLSEDFSDEFVDVIIRQDWHGMFDNDDNSLVLLVFDTDDVDETYAKEVVSRWEEIREKAHLEEDPYKVLQFVFDEQTDMVFRDIPGISFATTKPTGAFYPATEDDAFLIDREKDVTVPAAISAAESLG